eukprot:GHVR01149278.1.p1 GENE.GHVR01149278.1~~GHVR01149278.1.p1  ORF type:complete len:117 (-),score=3.77 GHVR01149278.1:516-866(-)
MHEHVLLRKEEAVNLLRQTNTQYPYYSSSSQAFLSDCKLLRSHQAPQKLLSALQSYSYHILFKVNEFNIKFLINIAVQAYYHAKLLYFVPYAIAEQFRKLGMSCKRYRGLAYKELS